METLRDIWYDIKRDLKQSSDDLEITDEQGIFWVLVVGDRLRSQHITKRNSGAFLTTLILGVATDTTFGERRYLLLPGSIYDFNNDGAVESISYFDADAEQPEFSIITGFRTSPSVSRTREMSFYQKATAKHFKWWREGDRLYLMGVHPAIEKMEVKLYMNLPDITTVDIDKPFDFPKELLYPLKRAVIDMGRFVLAIPGQQLNNDGLNRIREQVQGTAEKTTSVNSPLVNTDE